MNYCKNKSGWYKVYEKLIKNYIELNNYFKNLTKLMKKKKNNNLKIIKI